MRLNYLRLAFRSLLKNKVITSINILGLSIGISAALVIYLIVQYDYSFDRYEPGRNRIYRLVTHGDNYDNAGVPVPLPRALAGIPGIEKQTFLLGMNDGGTKVSIPEGNGNAPRLFKKQDNIVYTDDGYFSVFPHQWLAGSPGNSLKAPYRIVLSESLVRRYFPGLSSGQALGRTVTIDDSISTVVSGVVKDLDASTDFDNRAFISLATIPASAGLKDQYEWEDWGSVNSVDQVVLLLSPGVRPATVEQQVAAVARPHQTSGFEKMKFGLQPLSDIHFNQGLEGRVSRSTLVNLSLLALFILLLGAINFINLSTAQASERAKEVGMRKILGSSNGQLVIRYLNETFVLTTVSTLFSLLITPLLIKGFADFMPQGLDAARIWQPHVLLFLVGLIIVVSLLSGIYPALVLTRLQPLAATRNQPLSSGGSSRRVWLRKSLTVSQFVIAQVFIIGVLVVKTQIHFAISKDMGFRKDAIIHFYLPLDFAHPDGKKYVLANKLRSMPEIQAVSLGNQPPAMGGSMSTRVEFKEGKKDIRLPVDSRDGDTNFIPLYHIRLLAGHNVIASDSPVQYIVNATLAKQLGFQHPEDAVGHFLYQGNGDKGSPIIGVAADFSLASVRTEIHPAIYTYNLKYSYVMHIWLNPAAGSMKATIAKIQKAWEEVYPDHDFDYQFLNDTIKGFYRQEQQLSQLLSWAAGVAILISCLGLLGLVIFTANQRTKEIGIRKVLGASVTQIIALLSKDFIRLVVLAFVIAVPVAWWGAHAWLQNFAYHTGVSWWIFVISGASMLVVALLILSLRAGRAALVNPVESLRTE